MYRSILFLIFYCFLTACNKQDDFLSEKPNIALSTLDNLTDLQNLLNNESVFNRNDPSLGALTAEDYYVTDKVWNNTTSPIARNTYIFATDIYGAYPLSTDWTTPYNAIYVANTVLQAFDSFGETEKQSQEGRQVQGQALFYRSWKYYGLLQDFTLPYDTITASTTLGLPLRLSPDLNSKVQRSNLKLCYQQVIADLKKALELLPQSSLYVTRPNKTSVRAALARIYLGLSNYDSAAKYAAIALEDNHQLVDFNTLSKTRYPIASNFLSEDIFHSTLVNSTFIAYNSSSIDGSLYNSYDQNDLRKSIYFITTTSGFNTFKGSYDFKRYQYNGLATDELYLIKSECDIRLGNTQQGIDLLNTLLLSRYVTGTFKPYGSLSQNRALEVLLSERRKELVFRGVRWSDLRRLNQQSAFKSTLQRTINGLSYSLPPGDPRFAMPIPNEEIKLNEITQNIR
ncbi:RagB/SusD family nutrient uptake outer membrane protein [Rhizosphaericola mali]|uniref:RagB/SusD family nutrient uptake outer membrane protein n=1 Tax=Rhizosphaericola mali TaxID=2545455 RepID=A0A5P2FYR7_9BACT|nr:RagB/SusD family nutrient uptake outer membrane protein [Rhizosphaericola mali]QES88077.1 RagB/SusD family nutrient uptake outer membrane protein [Rhizosphaericola mali]